MLHKVEIFLGVMLMPHFVVDCSENLLKAHTAETMLRAIHDTAKKTELFNPKDIKTRVRTFTDFTVADDDSDFIHVFGNIMDGRTTEQKAKLSRAIVMRLKELFPDVPVISMNVREFEKATYCNLRML